MKVDFQITPGQLVCRFGICSLLVFVWLAQLGIRAQTNMQSGTVLPPPKATLVPVHWPDLTKLESDVREQLSSLQSSLAATVTDPGSTEAKLSQAYGTIGEIYHAYSLTTPARECYLNASRLAPWEFRWVYLLAKLDQQEGRVDEAIQGYVIARKLRPQYVAVPVNLGEIFLQLNRLDDAKASYEQALALDENSGAAQYGLGQVALARRSYVEAVNYLEKTLKQTPDANRVHYSLAMAYRGLGDAEKAKAHLAQQGSVGVRISDPLVEGLQELIKGERVHLIRGRLALEVGRFSEAAAEFRKAVAAKSDSVPAHVNLGAALTQTGDLRGALEQFEETLRIDPQNVNAHYNLAVLFARENEHEEAIRHLQSVLSTDPNDLNARFLLARELLKSRRDKDALAEFSRLVQVDPNNEEALLEQVKLLLRLKEYRQALDSLEKGHAKYPQKGQTATMLAYMLAASPQYDLRNGARALELAQLVYQASGSEVHGALVAMALAELGRCGQAAEWLRKIIAEAEQEHNTALALKLRAELQRYEQVGSCRPEIDLSEQPYEENQ